jgi:hypothetical protein
LDGSDAIFLTVPEEKLGIIVTQYKIPKLDGNYLFLEEDPYSWEKMDPDYLASTAPRAGAL